MDEERPLPAWYDDAKFGIMVHWGPYSVPAYAPRVGRVWDSPITETPYAEWYWNSLKAEGSSVARHHAATYGAEYPYERFAETFKTESAGRDPRAWAALFAAAGAKYVVPVTKHHDGFCMWPTAHSNPKMPAWYHADQDLVGELGEAVRERGMRYGLYYSGGLDWPFHDVPITSFETLGAAIPRSPEYIDYAFAHWVELIDRYEPACLWNDIFMPGPRERLEELFAYYWSKVPDGVVNDRWKASMGPEGMRATGHHDFKTSEYQEVAGIAAKKWESVRGIGHAFGWNREEPEEDYLSVEALVHMFIDTVSKGGNLLLNVGPMADGTIPAVQESRLRGFGRWLGANGEAVYGTRPWSRAAGTMDEGTEVRFVRKGADLFAHVLRAPEAGPRFFHGLRLSPGCEVSLVGGGPLRFQQEEAGVAVYVPGGVDPAPAYAVRFSGAAEG